MRQDSETMIGQNFPKTGSLEDPSVPRSHPRASISKAEAGSFSFRDVAADRGLHAMRSRRSFGVKMLRAEHVFIFRTLTRLIRQHV